MFGEVGMSIYLDVIWVLNFFLDSMLLMLTKALAKEHISNWRIFFGAFIASLLVPISILMPQSFFTTLYGKCLYSIIIILATFGFFSINRLMKLALLFYFISFSIGGGLVAVYFLMNHSFSIAETGILTFHSGLGDPISWLFVIIGFPISWYFTKKRMDNHGNEKIRYDQLYPVAITIKNQTFRTTGYVDSGNQLVDPITKRCVVICDEYFMKQWFSEEEWNQLKESFSNFSIQNIPFNWQDMIQVIPFHGVSGNNSFLYAIRPEKLSVLNNEKEIVTNHVLIGIQFGTLTKDGKYHCLLHPQMMKYKASLPA